MAGFILLKKLVLFAKLNAKVKIPTFHNQVEGGKEVTFYKVEMNLNGTKWTLDKRFNEFHVLNEALKPTHGNLPSLPGKTLLPVKKLEDIDKRRDGLEKYLQGLASKLDVYASKTFVHFLDLDRKSTRLNSSHRNTSRMPSSA